MRSYVSLIFAALLTVFLAPLALRADVTIPAPPVRPKIDKLGIIELAVTATALKAGVEVRAGSNLLTRTVVEIRPGASAVCLQYNANGDMESFECKTAGCTSMTPAAALAAFAGGAGGFGGKSDALAVYFQGKGCLPQ